MGRSDATHIAVGGSFFGVGAGSVLALLIYYGSAPKYDPWHQVWYLTLVAVFGLLTVLGAWAVLSVYTGWKMPSTASERAARPDLRWLGAVVTQLDTFAPNEFLLSCTIANVGRSAIHRATVNVMVPAFAENMQRVDGHGNPVQPAGTFGNLPNESLIDSPEGNPVPTIYWAGVVSLNPRVNQNLTFRMRIHDLWLDLPVRVLVNAEGLEPSFTASDTADLAAVSFG